MRPSPSTPAGEVQQRLAFDRTHLANERTYAAWLRTGLSVAAGGIAVAHLVPEPSRDSLVSLGLGAAFVVLGVGVMTYGARQFARVTWALAAESGRPAPVAPRATYALTALVGALLTAVLLFLWSHQGRPSVRATAAAAVQGEAGVEPRPRTAKAP